MTDYKNWQKDVVSKVYSSFASVTALNNQLKTITSLSLPPGKYKIDATFCFFIAETVLQTFESVDVAATTDPTTPPFQKPEEYGKSQVQLSIWQPAQTPAYAPSVSGAISGFIYENDTDDNQNIYLIFQDGFYPLTAKATLTATQVVQ